MIVCPSCGETNPERARFCLGCGTELAAAAPPPGSRKMVTIVFCDVTESTALGEALDPEALQGVMKRYFAAMRAALEDHGGTVEKFIGDAVVAVFGIPVLHEDDALRAVRAAAAMQRALADLNRELSREGGVSLGARTGINTGEVIASGITPGEPFATGDAVNVAARLEQSAVPGDVLIGETTYRLVRHAVRVEPVAPLTVKGKSAPVTAYRLLEVSGDHDRRRRLSSPLVGRERELDLLRQAFGRATDDRSAQLFTLLGAPGVGKSRLISEFVDGLAGSARVIQGRCLSYGAGITFWPLREAVQEAAGIAAEDDVGAAVAKIEALLPSEAPSSGLAQQIAGLTGLAGDADGTRDGAWAARKLFESLAEAQPLVAVFDDIHWAEPTFLDLVEHVARWSRDAPILLVCAARPDLLDARRGWGGDLFNASTALLEPLDDEFAGRLVDNLVGDAELTDGRREKLVQAAEGNPLFVEELIEMLVDERRLDEEAGGWVGGRDAVDLRIPPTIHALLAARLDALEPGDRRALAHGAVEGKVFHRSALLALGDGADAGEIDRHLRNLVQKDLVRPERSSVAGDDEFRFRHQLIRDAAYDALPKETRADLHERFANWLLGVAHTLPGEVDELVGFHLEQACLHRAELRSGAAWESAPAEDAARHLSAAGHRAAARNDVPAAITLLARAGRLFPPGAERLTVHAELGRMLNEANRLDEAVEVFEEVVRDSDANPAAAARARLGLLLASNQRGTGLSMEDTLAAVKRVAGELEQLGDELGLARALLYTGVVTAWTGRISEAQALLEHALNETRSASGTHERAMIASWLALCLWWGPTPVDEAAARSAALAAEAAGDREANGVTACAIGVLVFMQGDVDSARALIARARADLLEIGSTLAWAGTSFAALSVELGIGAYDRALELGKPVVAELQSAGEFGYLSTIAAQMADAACELGMLDEAAAYLRMSAGVTVAGDWISITDCNRVQAKLLAQQGAADPAARLVEETLTDVRGRDDPNVLGQTLVAAADVMRLSGRNGDEEAYLREAIEVFEQKGNKPAARLARDRVSRRV